MATTVVLTFDNLGEAAELEQGTWPADAPRGEHPSVVEALPSLLDLLDELGFRATFFVEAVNTVDYPEAVRELADRGHEVGFHAWRHERWAELDAERERELVQRSAAATYLYPPFAELRRGLGLSAAPLDARAFEDRLWRELEREPDPFAATLILHPFLSADPPVGEAHARILRRLRGLADDGAVRVLDGAEAAAELRSAPDPPRPALG